MKTLKWLFSNLHRYVLWLLVSVFIWGWIFTLVTDTVRAKKVVVYSDAPGVDADALAETLERELPKGIRMVKVHAVDYALFDPTEVNDADLLILSEKEVGELFGSLSPITGMGFDDDACYKKDGIVYGILIYDAASGKGNAAEYFTFKPADGETPQSYYLCFNSASAHIGDLNGSKDDAAIVIAERILSLP